MTTSALSDPIENIGYWHHPVEDIEPLLQDGLSNASIALGRTLDFHRIERTTPAPHAFARFIAMLFLVDRARYLDGRDVAQAAQVAGVPPSTFRKWLTELSTRSGLPIPSDQVGQAHLAL